MSDDEKRYDPEEIDDGNETFDETQEKFDELRGQLDEMIDGQVDKMNTIFKKSVVYSAIWSFVAVVAYFVWPDDWYFWVPAVIAILSIASMVFVVIMRKKLQKTLDKKEG